MLWVGPQGLFLFVTKDNLSDFVDLEAGLGRGSAIKDSSQKGTLPGSQLANRKHPMKSKATTPGALRQGEIALLVL